MEITEVRIKLMEDSDDRLQAFCSITFDDCFVVRDLKIIDGSNGPFVAMPSRKLTSHCGNCGCKNHLRANFCNQCGQKQRRERDAQDADGRSKLYADIAHPVNSECREMIQTRVISEFEEELERAKKPGYKSRYDDDYSEAQETDFAGSQQTPPPTVQGLPQGTLQGPHRRTGEPTAQAADDLSEGSRDDRTGSSSGGFGAGIFD